MTWKARSNILKASKKKKFVLYIHTTIIIRVTDLFFFSSFLFCLLVYFVIQKLGQNVSTLKLGGKRGREEGASLRQLGKGRGFPPPKFEFEGLHIYVYSLHSRQKRSVSIIFYPHDL